MNNLIQIINKIYRYIILFLISILIFTSCTEYSSNIDDRIENKNIVWSMLKEPDYIDPGMCGPADGSTIITNMFEGLYIMISDDITPAVALSHTVSKDGLEYIFELRSNAKWSDGKPVEAKDFEFSWKRTVDPLFPSPQKNLFSCIKNANDIISGKKNKDSLGVVATDPLHLKVTLERPTDYFLSLTTLIPFMPVREDIVNNNSNWMKNPDDFVSNGPFSLASYKNDRYIMIGKNKYYWNKSNLGINSIMIRFIPDISTAYAGYLTGEIDILENIPLDNIKRLKATGHLINVPRALLYFYSFNCNLPHLQDCRVRKAISLSIDRTALVNKVRKTGEEIATGYIYPNLSKNYRRSEFNTYTANMDNNVIQAKKLMQQAGYNRNHPFPTIDIFFNSESNNKIIAEAIQEMLKKNLGIKTNLISQEWSVFFDNRRNIRYNGIARNSWLWNYIDQLSILEIFKTKGASNTGYSNPDYDQLLNQIVNSSGIERENNINKAEDILLQDVPAIPLFYYSTQSLIRNHIKNYKINSLGYKYLGNCFLDKNDQIINSN